LQLDVPATMYKDRTFVPLRFVGEAFGGTVNWDGATKQVVITLPEPTIEEFTSQTFLNDRLLEFGEFTPIEKDKTIYIPMESVLDNVPNEVYWERRGNGVFVQVDGVNMNFYIGGNSVTVDGQLIDLSKPLIEYEGQVMVPINVFAKILGGYAQYVAATDQLFIYVNRGTFSHDFVTKEQETFAKPTNVASASFEGNRRIMVSDNPENLNERTIPTDNETLWQDEVRSSNASMDNRVFGWHINEFDQNVTVGITIENLSKTNEIEIVAPKGTFRTTPNGWVNYDVGLPLSERALSGKLTNVKMSSPAVKAGENVLMKSFEIKSRNTLGFQYDFTVKKKSGTGELNYKIRTVISKNGSDLATILNDPVEIDQTARHPRGVWSSSQLKTELPAYEVGSGEAAFQISNGATDNLMSPEKGIGDQTKMIRNPGHFGASYIVKIPIINKTGDSKTVRVRFGARGGIYNGAVKVDGKVYLIPTLKPMSEVANIFDYVAEKESGMIELEIMHAGGSALPLAIDLITVEEEPQDDLQDVQDVEGVKNPQDIEDVQNTQDSQETQNVENTQESQAVQEVTQ